MCKILHAVWELLHVGIKNSWKRKESCVTLVNRLSSVGEDQSSLATASESHRDSPTDRWLFAFPNRKFSFKHDLTVLKCGCSWEWDAQVPSRYKMGDSQGVTKVMLAREKTKLAGLPFIFLRGEREGLCRERVSEVWLIDFFLRGEIVLDRLGFWC